MVLIVPVLPSEQGMAAGSQPGVPWSHTAVAAPQHGCRFHSPHCSAMSAVPHHHCKPLVLPSAASTKLLSHACFEISKPGFVLYLLLFSLAGAFLIPCKLWFVLRKFLFCRR